MEPFSCVGREDGSYADPEDCQLYSVCSSESRQALDCGEGNRFHAGCRFCVLESQYNCSLYQEFCYNRTDGYYVDPTDPQSYYQCNNCGNGDGHSLTTHTTCADDLVWSEYYTNCVEPNDGFCLGKEDGIFADPNNCTKYYTCYDDGYGQSNTYCGASNRFHARCLYCVAENQFNCNSSDFCDGKEEGTYAHPSNSLLYYTCWNCSSENHSKVTSLNTCPSGGPWVDSNGDDYCSPVNLMMTSPTLSSIELSYVLSNPPVNVTLTPITIANGANISLVENVDYNFTCTVFGSEFANISWFLGGVLLDETEYQCQNESGINTCSTIVIAVSKNDHQKTLQCVAEHNSEQLSVDMVVDALCKLHLYLEDLVKVSSSILVSFFLILRSHDLF